ncbi:hypothetical protein BDAP_000815 [Binucleata daphniae]
MTQNQKTAHNAIITILKSKNKPQTQENILKVTIKTISDLINNKRIESTHIFMEILKTTTFTKNQEMQVLDIIFYFIKHNENAQATKIATEMFYNIFNGECNYELFVHFLQTNTTEITKKIILHNFIKFYSMYFIKETDKTNILGFIANNMKLISNICDIKTFIDIFYKMNMKKNAKICYRITYKITKILSEKHNELELVDTYKKIIEIMYKEEDENVNKKDLLKCLSIICKKNHIHLLKTNTLYFDILFDSNEAKIAEFYDFVGKMMINEVNAENVSVVKDIILSFGYCLQTVFAEFIDTTIKNYEEKNDANCYALLKTIVKSVGLVAFYDILAENNIQNVKKYVEIFKKGRNVDLSFLILFYSDFCNEKSTFFSVFSSITQFCTDKENKIDLLIKIIQKEMESKETENVKNIAIGLTKMIDTLMKYTTGNIILTNKITKQEIDNISNAIINAKYDKIFLKMYLENGGKEINNLVTLLLRINNNYTSYNYNEIFEYLQQNNENLTFEHKTNNYIYDVCNDKDDLYKVLSFFVAYMKPNLDISVKILQQCLSKNQKEQKLAYYMLCEMIKHKKTEVCLCTPLISNDYTVVYTCTKKQRLLTLFEAYKSCNLCEDKRDYLKKILLELFLSIKNNSAKSRKTSYDLLEMLINEKTYKNVLLMIFAGFGSQEYKIVNGSIGCLVYIIKERKEYIKNNVGLIVEQSQKLITKGVECYKSIIELYKTIVIELDVDKEEFIEHIGNFMNCKRKKTVDYIKKVALELKKKNIKLNANLNKAAKMRFKRRESIRMVTNKKGDVEIQQSKKEDSDSE